MPPNYFFHYFDIRAKGEPIRWILKVTGVDYKEERISFQDWPNRKSDFDYGKIPVLDVNGTQLYQTTVISKFLARSHNLAPTDPWENARLEEIAESANDVAGNFPLVFMTRSQNKLDEMRTNAVKFKEDIINFSKVVDKAISNEGWIRSKRMTWVDIFVAAFMDIWEVLFDNIYDEAPKLHRLVNEVRKHPAIHAWIESRPPLNPFERRPE